MKTNKYLLVNDQSLESKWRAYEKDFQNIGNFEENEDEGDEITLSYNIWPGMFNPQKKSWDYVKNTYNESYSITITYRSKKYIEIIFDASYGGGKNLKPSFDLMQTVAEKYYLVNQYLWPNNRKKLAGSINEHKVLDSKPISFEEIKEIIEYCRAKEHFQSEDLKYKNGQSWSKIMTLESAKSLMRDLKIKVRFPS